MVDTKPNQININGLQQLLVNHYSKLSSLALVRKPVKENENSEFKPAVLYSRKIDFVSYTDGRWSLCNN